MQAVIRKSLPAFILIFLAVALVQVAGGMVTATSVKVWYVELAKPVWTPPASVFAPVWTVLYLMMAYAACRVWAAGEWRQQTMQRMRAMQWFGVQLALNFSWSLVFFGFREPLAALMVLMLLIASVYNTIRVFRALDAQAAGWLLPYFAWLFYAFSLNAGIVWLNPQGVFG